MQAGAIPVRTDLSYMHLLNSRILVANDQAGEAVEYLEQAADGYRRSLALTRWRLELEACRIRKQLGRPMPRIEALVDELSGSGAAPLLQRALRLARPANVT